MIRVCAWCNTILDRNAIPPVEGQTHTICRSCWSNLEFQNGVSPAAFLESLPAPVVIVNGEGQVANANNAARTMLGKSLAQIAGHTGGEVFECKYARLPGGCGQTLHCSGCTIRRAVMLTFHTGENLYRVPATLYSAHNEAPIALRITTRLQDEMVLLHVEFVEDGEITEVA